MKALILAAGRGHRLWPCTSETPKCLLSLEEHETILQRQIRLLGNAGVERIVVVAGFGFSQVRTAVAHDPRVQVVYNPFFGVADNLISLWAARPHMDEDLLIVNGDNVFHPDLPGHLLRPIAPDCQLLVQRKSYYDDDDMKVSIRSGLLQSIGKQLPPEQIDAESIGLLSFRGRGVDQLHAILEEAVQAEQAMSSYYLDGIQRLANGGIGVHCVDAGRLPWADVDTPHDLATVRHSMDRFVRCDDDSHQSTRTA
ncbi:MAG: phosphocholine cytidylyltransferase family protein [Gemmatimonadetes bacterium]|nr:phosphocholine cytidylyltransferase family protein [Gemmatimonadota bacterium]MBT7860765.1 phosphocholine cytidylyltransferase family protein [Gemmatimonadota bacterium]